MLQQKKSLQPLKKAQAVAKWKAVNNHIAAPVSLLEVREIPTVSRKDFKPFKEHTGDVE